MKTEKQITELIESAKIDMIVILPDLQKSLENEDWEEVIQYCNGLIVGVCTVNAAQGLLEGGE